MKKIFSFLFIFSGFAFADMQLSNCELTGKSAASDLANVKPELRQGEC